MVFQFTTCLFMLAINIFLVAHTADFIRSSRFVYMLYILIIIYII